MATKHPACHVQWWIVDSSNVEMVGYDLAQGMHVKFKNGGQYLYHGVNRQRVVAAAQAPSVGAYINSKIKPIYECTKIV